MNHRLPLVLLVLVGLTLVACSNDEAQPGEDETAIDSTTESAAKPASEPDPTATDTDEPTTGLLEDPQALREAMRDPEQRDALMQAMRERRQARREGQGEGDMDRQAMREQMRQRREELMANRNADGRPGLFRERMGAQSEWWQDEAMRDSLGLDDAQAEALSAQRESLDARRAEARQQLAESQRELMSALKAVDRERLSALIEQRSAANLALQQLELDWWRTLLDQLSDEQLAALGQEHPHLFAGRRR